MLLAIKFNIRPALKGFCTGLELINNMINRGFEDYIHRKSAPQIYIVIFADFVLPLAYQHCNKFSDQDFFFYIKK